MAFLKDLKPFLGGFDLAGERQPDGKLKAYGYGTIIDDWPKEVTYMETTYTLEDVTKGVNGHENAIYV